jgi:hypothetical protein
MTRWWWEATLLAVLSGCGHDAERSRARTISRSAAAPLAPAPDLADAEHQWTIAWIARLCAEDAGLRATLVARAH